ncbi:MAG: thiamine diphosphokinase [Candidatus Marinimicrobia bacterium]|nr:thiamine diphosphokinase [Candidatus Neomarinimicrobiota bacterium]
MNVLLVLGGAQPTQQLLATEFARADLTIAIDGGMKVFQQGNMTPQLLIGDLDSYDKPLNSGLEILQVRDQNSTDLQKAFVYVFKNYQPDAIVLLGATGGRTDHLVNNLHICASIDSKCQIILKNDNDLEAGFTMEELVRVTPETETDLEVNNGATLSIIAVSAFNGLHSKGLKWEIIDANSDSGYFSQSNLVNSDNPRISLHSGCVYVAVYQ